MIHCKSFREKANGTKSGGDSAASRDTMIQIIAKKCVSFMQKEVVLCVAVLCAAISFFFSPELESL